MDDAAGTSLIISPLMGPYFYHKRKAQQVSIMSRKTTCGEYTRGSSMQAYILLHLPGFES